MKSDRTPRHASEFAIALAIGVVFSVLVALGLAHWSDSLRRLSFAKKPTEAAERSVEIMFEQPEDERESHTENDDPESDDEDEDPADEQAQAEMSVPNLQEPELQVPPPVVPERPPEPTEVEPEQPAAVEPVDARAAVDQPTTNEEVPDVEDFFWAEVDNRTDEQTTAEQAVNQLDDVETVERVVTESSEEPTPESGDGANSDQQMAPGEDTAEETGDDDRTDDVRGAQAQSIAQATTEGARPSEMAEGADSSAPDEGDAVAEHDNGAMEAGELGSEGAEQISASDRMAQAFENAAGTGDEGAGASSTTRDGAVAAHASFDELFGERTATARERARAQRRREGLSGDHQHDWERTREALENHDILVAAGEETHLNTRRSAHASFINQYHNRIHPRWRSFTNSLGTGGSANRVAHDMTLKTVVDIRVLADGEVETVRIRRSSGSTYFDAEAVRVHMSVGLGPSPPQTIVCGDGAVYIRWIMSRNIEGCGTFNATLHCPG